MTRKIPLMDPPTTSIIFTVADGTDAREPAALDSALVRRLRTILGVIVCALLCIGLSTAGIHSPSSVVADDDWMTPMQKSFNACMEAWDLPVSISAPSQGFPTSVSYQGAHTAMWRDLYGYTGIAPAPIYGDLSDSAFSPSYIAEINAISRVIDLSDKPLLAADGTDYSSQYIACLDRSGYSAEAAREQAERIWLYSSAGEDLDAQEARFQPQVQLNNQWAACARDHGWLVFDSTLAVMDDTTAYPEVDVPSSITPDQLHTLLAACPNFDVNAARLVDEWSRAQTIQRDVTTEGAPTPVISSTPNAYYNPNVGFRLTPFETAHLSTLFSLESRALFARLVPLYMVLDEQRTAYNETQSLS